VIIPLHVHSYFSLLRGASSVEDLVARAAELGYPALGLTDRDALYGAVRLGKACKEAGIHPVYGCELTLVGSKVRISRGDAEDAEKTGEIFSASSASPREIRTLLPTTHLTLIAENQPGYANLCRLISAARRDRPKGEAALSFATLAEHAEGVIALSGPRTGEIPQLLLARRPLEAAAAADRYREVFGDRFFLELQSHLLPDDDWLMAELAALGRAKGIELVATTDVHYARPDRRMLQDVLTCIRTRTTLAAPSAERLPNAGFGLEPPEELQRRFARYPEALAHTHRIAERCSVSLDYRSARFPPLDLPNGETADAALRRKCVDGMGRLYHSPTDQVVRQLEHELSVVAQAGLAPFFLIAADVARRFRGRCRGSAAGSLIVYCLGVSAVDPLRYGMLFERFINPERPTMPDIDIDFSEWEREQAIAYVYQTYGAERAAMVCNYVRYRARLAVRDVGQVLGMPLDLLGRLAKSLDHHLTGEDLAKGIAEFVGEGIEETDLTRSRGDRGDSQSRTIQASDGPRVANRPAEASTPGDDEASPFSAPSAAPRETLVPQHPASLLIQLCQQIDDFPRHLSVHVGGMLVTGQPLVELFGLEPARKEGIVVVGGDKEDVEDSGLGKLDLLCLRALSVVQEAEKMEQERGIPLDLRTINLEDPEIYRMLRQADTIGASQVESRAQMQSVVRTQPRRFRDLINQCAIIRPGPIVAGMVHPYNRRRLGLEKVAYLHPLLEPITRDTLGIFLFQEQIILGVMALTGCSAGEADVFRRAMGSHRSREAMQKLGPWFIERAQVNGIAYATASEAFRQISGFADFGFCKSHSAALARTAYEGLYLKRYHPAAFYAALVSNQPMGFYPVEVLVWDGRRRGLRFLPVDINLSGARCTLGGGGRTAPPHPLPHPLTPSPPKVERENLTPLSISDGEGLGVRQGWGEGTDTQHPIPIPPIRLGFEQVHWVGKDIAVQIVAEREAGGPFRSLVEFGERTGLGGKPVEGLILAGAFDFTGQGRQDLLWELYGRANRASQHELGLTEARPELPERTVHEQTLLDHYVLGFSLDRHLVENYRRRLRALGVTPSSELNRKGDGEEVRVGGMVVCRQRPGTAKGFVFVTLEDERGLVNVIVRPDVYQTYRDAFRNATLIAVAGRVQRAFGATNILASRAIALDLRTPDPEVAAKQPQIVASVRSHNFR
jgi:error-prone DNA polymerase